MSALGCLSPAGNLFPFTYTRSFVALLNVLTSSARGLQSLPPSYSRPVSVLEQFQGGSHGRDQLFRWSLLYCWAGEKTKRCFSVMLCYYAGGTSQIIRGAPVFFGHHANAVQIVLLWLALSAVLAAPWAALSFHKARQTLRSSACSSAPDGAAAWHYRLRVTPYGSGVNVSRTSLDWHLLTFLAPILALLTLASESRIPREPIGWLTAIVRLL